MAIQIINIGTNPNDGTGDDLRTAFDKVNDNFTELLAVGGETNTGSNLGIGEGIFKQKTAQNLEFKSLRNSDGTIAISSDGNSVYLNTSNLADNDFGSIQVDNGNTLTASSSGQLFGIKSGNANIGVTLSGNDIVITGAFEVSNDATPQLGGDLDVNGNAFVSTSNGNITFTPNGTGKIVFNDLAYYPEVAITSSSNAVAWDSQAAPNAKHTTTENTTFSAPSNAQTGGFIALNIQYGGTHTIAWNTVFEFAASTAPTATSTSGKSDQFVFRYNGTVWQEVGRSLNMSAT